MRKRGNFFEAIAILTGITIGAGILGIPIVVAKAGFFTGLLLILILGLVVIFMNLMIGEISLRTKKDHQLTGYTRLYLGKTGKIIMTVIMILFGYGALLAYLIGEGQALAELFSLNPLISSLIFFLFMAILLFFGLRIIAHSELLLVTLLLLVIALMVVFSFGHVNVSNLIHFDIYKMLIPYGVIFFALLGGHAVPEMKEELRKNKKSLRKAIIIGTLIPIIIYVIFAIIVVGVSGMNTTEIATIGLGQIIGHKMFVFGNLFAVLAMATSFLALGLALKEMFYFDFGINKNLAWALTCFIPLILFLIGIRSFINVLSFIGAIAGGLIGLLMIFTYWNALKKSQRKPEYSLKFGKQISYVLMIIFIFGIIYTIYTLL